MRPPAEDVRALLLCGVVGRTCAPVLGRSVETSECNPTYPASNVAPLAWEDFPLQGGFLLLPI